MKKKFLLAYTALIILTTTHTTLGEKLKVRLGGDRIVVFSPTFCGSQRINPKSDFIFQVQFKGSRSKEIHFTSTKDEHIYDVDFDSEFPEVYSNFSLKVFKDNKHEFKVVIYQDGGTENSRIDCPRHERSEHRFTIKTAESLLIL